MEVRDNQFLYNTAADDAGGLKLSHSTNEVIDNYFEGNETGDAGGGLELDNETSTVTGNVFVANKAYRGGGLHAWYNEGAMTISDSEFYDNEASDCGAGMQIDNMHYRLTLSNIWFENNVSSNDGGGLCVDEVIQVEDDKSTWSYESYVTLQNVVFWGNIASDDGGALYSKTGHLEIYNTTSTDNEGPSAGGMMFKRTTAQLVNNIISDNAGPGLAVEEDEGEGSSVIGSYNDLVNNSGGNFSGMDDFIGEDGNIEEDPDYVDAASGDFNLEPTSPCVDAGDPALRDPDGSRSDMGATGGPGA